MTKRRKIILGILAVFLLMQAIQPSREAPAVEPSKDFLARAQMPEELKKLVRDACYDCHSYESKYPGYAYVAPISYWIQHHINDGRKHLNFSTWTDYDAEKKQKKLAECAEEIDLGNMPMGVYVLMHSEAKLPQKEGQALLDWFKAQGGNQVEKSENQGAKAQENEGEKHEEAHEKGHKD